MASAKGEPQRGSVQGRVNEDTLTTTDQSKELEWPPFIAVWLAELMEMEHQKWMVRLSEIRVLRA